MRTGSTGKFHVAPEAVYQFETVIPGPARNGHVMAENCREFLTADSERPFFLYFYPMRVVRERRWKLIWNIAYPLPFPFASDLWAAPTWQVQYQQGRDAPFGPWTVGRYIQRPEFELFDLERDPYEAENLAEDPRHAAVLAEMIAKLQEFQRRTDDPWIIKWEYD